MVDSEEPLRNELSSFVESVRTRSEPKVTGEDGIEALHIARQTDRVGDTESRYLDLRPPSEVSLD
jgi:predicted dehydrogenase